MRKTSDEQHESVPRWLGGLVLAMVAASVALFLQANGGSGAGRMVGELERATLDARFRLREQLAPTQVDEDIVILLIEDPGIAYYEHRDLLGPTEDGFPQIPIVWPWPRGFYGQAVTYLKAAGARTVFFDFLFSGSSIYSNLAGGDDDELADACAAAGNVFHPLLFQEPIDPEAPPSMESDGDESRRVLEARLAAFPLERLAAARVPDTDAGLNSYAAVEVPLPMHGMAARGLGAINATLDSDGIVRRVELLSRFQGHTYRSIQLALAADSLGEPGIRWDPDGPAITLGETRIPVDESGQMLVNWHGPAKSYTTRGLHRLLLKTERGTDPDEHDRNLYEGKTVLIGSSAVALQDLKATPFGSKYPGVEVHATALDNILNGDFIHRPRGLWRALSTAAFFLVAGQLLMRRRGAGSILAIAIGLLGLWIAAAAWAFVSAQTWIDIVIPSGGLLALFAGAQAVQFFTVGRQKREMRSAFQRYLPPAVVNEVLRLPADELKLGGDRRELSVYFSDIQGFTSISERLAPEQLVSMLNVYLGEMSDIITRRNGTLDKYIGDCVMAFWGAPLPLENGPLDACLAALESQERLVGLRAEFRAQKLPEIHARIGINTGPMLVGNLGSDRHFSFTVMGDAVNLASRLEGANKAYGTRIMLGPETVARAGAGIETRELDLMTVKGRSQPVHVYELMAAAGQLTDLQKRVRDAFLAGLAAYRVQDWKRALAEFEACLTLDAGDGPSQTYRDRCVLFRENPPSNDWDGVFEMRTK